jgi:hypothetical protein
VSRARELIDPLIARCSPHNEGVVALEIAAHALDLLERLTIATEQLAGAVGVIAGVITQPDPGEETGAPDPLSTMDG